MENVTDKGGENAANNNANVKEQKAKTPRAKAAPKAATAKAPKAATGAFERKIAKGYKSPIQEHWDTLVDSESETYAFLEVEQRAFSGTTGKKTSKPAVVSYNRTDFATFIGFGIQKAEAGKEQQISMKDANGFSINAVLHIPAKFNMDVDVDELPERD